MTTETEVKMKPIMFTQYLRSNGEKRPAIIDRPAPIANKADMLRLAGWRLECEVLTTGEVSFTCEHDDSEGDVDLEAIRVVKNGPGTAEAVDSLIEEAYRMAGEPF